MEQESEKLFSKQGISCVAIRKIAGLLLLKELFKESDESVVASNSIQLFIKNKTNIFVQTK